MMMICPACNSEFLSYSEHCEHCGAPAYLATAAQMAEVTHCTYCGARDELGSNGCLTCGLKKAFKTSESLIGICRNCGIAWRNTWLYCQICGVARENGLVDTMMPLTISTRPHNPGVSASVRRGAYAAAHRHNPSPELHEPVPSVEDSIFSAVDFISAGDFKAITELERQTMLNETEVVARMYVNNDNKSALPSQNELEQFFSTSEIFTQQPIETPSKTGKPVTTEAEAENLPTRPEAAPIPSPSSTEISATAPPTEPRLETPTKVVQTISANATAPAQTVRVIDKPYTVSPPISTGLVRTIIVLIGLIVLFSALIVSGFRIRDLFERTDQPKAPHPQPSASPLPTAAQPIPAPPPGMVYIPGGAFRMGSEDADTYESPVHEVTVAPFFMDRTEVSNAQYAEFLKAAHHAAPPDWKDNKYPSGSDQMPVVNVSWQDANDYAAWAGKRLPTEAEWEFAARTTDARLYPWGMKWETAKANTNETGLNRPVEVNSYADAANPFGLLNMAGNVWEWTASEVQSYKDASVLLAPGRIIRGGAFYTPKERATTSYRGFAQPDKQASGIGFRCVKDVN